MIVTGEIASGKTTFSNLLCEHLGFGTVSTRECVAKVMAVTDFGQGDRTEFQQKAAELIAEDDGVEQLADEIAGAAGKLTGRAVIDGVRHRRTVEAVRRRLGNVIVMFVDCARDDALRNYRRGTGRDATVAEFRRARAHPVEEEVKTLRYEADAYIFNGGEPDAMLDLCRGWWR